MSFHETFSPWLPPTTPAQYRAVMGVLGQYVCENDLPEALAAWIDQLTLNEAREFYRVAWAEFSYPHKLAQCEMAHEWLHVLERLHRRHPDGLRKWWQHTQQTIKNSRHAKEWHE